VGDGAVINVPLRGLGVHNFYLRLHIRVGSGMPLGARGAMSREMTRVSID
jgi:hypothetical protein